MCGAEGQIWMGLLDQIALKSLIKLDNKQGYYVSFRMQTIIIIPKYVGS